MDKYMIELRNENEQEAEAKRQLKYIDDAKTIVTDISGKLGRPLYSCVVTFGCQMYAKCTTV